jgi:hypothetical protein
VDSSAGKMLLNSSALVEKTATQRLRIVIRKCGRLSRFTSSKLAEGCHLL